MPVLGPPVEVHLRDKSCVERACCWCAARLPDLQLNCQELDAALRELQRQVSHSDAQQQQQQLQHQQQQQQQLQQFLSDPLAPTTPQTAQVGPGPRQHTCICRVLRFLHLPHKRKHCTRPCTNCRAPPLLCVPLMRRTACRRPSCSYQTAASSCQTRALPQRRLQQRLQQRGPRGLLRRTGMQSGRDCSTGWQHCRYGLAYLVQVVGCTTRASGRPFPARGVSPRCSARPSRWHAGKPAHTHTHTQDSHTHALCSASGLLCCLPGRG